MSRRGHGGLLDNRTRNNPQADHGVDNHQPQHGHLAFQHQLPIAVQQGGAHVGQVDRDHVAPHDDGHQEEPNEPGVGDPYVYRVLRCAEQVPARAEGVRGYKQTLIPPRPFLTHHVARHTLEMKYP